MLKPSLLLIVHNAPGRSCYNVVERAMAFLNGAIAGVTLSAFEHGEHIVNGKVPTALEELEKKNVQSAVDRLHALWTDSVVVNRDTMDVRKILVASDEHTDLVNLILKYKKRPSSLLPPGIFN